MGLLACACHFESVLEDFLSSWCFSEGHKENDFKKRIMQKVEKDVSRSTGLEQWKSWFKVLFDLNLTQVLGQEWEKLTQLFKLRNQLAHGRNTKYMYLYKEDGAFCGMSTERSGYHEILDYLIKNKVIEIPKGKIPSANTFLTKQVFAHFNSAVESSILLLTKCKALRKMALYLNESREFETANEFDNPRDLDLIEEIKVDAEEAES